MTPTFARGGAWFTVLFAIVIAAAGCGDTRPDASAAPVAEDTLAMQADQADTLLTVDSAAAAAGAPALAAPAQIRGLYLNAYQAGSRKRRDHYLAIADSTEINTFVVDVKTERGIHYSSEVPLANELQQDGENTLRNLEAFVETLHAHGVYAMARIVLFKDPILSKAKPDWSIRTEDGGLWVDKAGNTWVSAWDPNVWDYNLAIAEEVAKAGFDEIQFDYVRFPEPYKSLPPQVHRAASGDRTDAIAAFLNEAKTRLHPLGVVVAADVFGLSPNDPRDVGIGQQWETIASTADHILPMMYPSHYLSTHLPGVPKPDLMPYETLYKSAGMAVLRTDKMTEAGIEPARIIPWLQAFSATWLGKNHQEYGPQQLLDQTRGVYEVGLEDWVLWHPGSKYDHIVPALAKETVSQAKEYSAPDDVLRAVDLFEKQGVREARERAAEQAKGR